MSLTAGSTARKIGSRLESWDNAETSCDRPLFHDLPGIRRSVKCVRSLPLCDGVWLQFMAGMCGPSEGSPEGKALGYSQPVFRPVVPSGKPLLNTFNVYPVREFHDLTDSLLSGSLAWKARDQRQGSVPKLLDSRGVYTKSS